MAQLIRRGRYPAELMASIAKADADGTVPSGVAQARPTADAPPG